MLRRSFFSHLNLLIHGVFYTWWMSYLAEKILLNFNLFQVFYIWGWHAWQLLEYFQLLATFAAKFVHFHTSYCSFHCICPTLNYNIVYLREDKGIYYEDPRLLINGVFNPILIRQSFLTGKTMIWYDNRKKDAYRISLLGFLLYFTTLSIVNWNVSLRLLNLGIAKKIHWVLFGFIFRPFSLYQSFIVFRLVSACSFARYY